MKKYEIQGRIELVELDISSNFEHNMKRGENMNAYDEYMKGIVKPMREELAQNGFTELTTAEDVEGTMETLEGTALVVINSVCGCAAGLARPAVREALQEANINQIIY